MLKSGSPVGNVYMMTRPISELTSRIVKDPSPVPVGNAPVWYFWCRTKPHLPVQLSRNFLYRRSANAPSSVGQSDFNIFYFSCSAINCKFSPASEVLLRALPAACLPDNVILFYS